MPKHLEFIEKKMPWEEPRLGQGLHSKHIAQAADLVGSGT